MTSGGSGWTYGAGAPSTLTSNGAFYLDTVTGDVYQQESGSWVGPVYTPAPGLPTGSGNKLVATPANGGSGVSALRALVAADIPSLSSAYDVVGSASAALVTAEAYTDAAVGVEASSRATADALLVPKTTTVNGHALSANVTVAFGDIASGALANGTTATTQAASDNSTKVATTAYADAAVGVEASARATADGLLVPKTTTVNGHALSANVTVAFGDIASGALASGTTATTQAALDNSTNVATTAYTDAAVSAEATLRSNADALKAPLASPALTGTPTAPTPSTADSSTTVATTSFVHSLLGGFALPSSGLIGEYRFLEGSGYTTADSSGAGNNATLGNQKTITNLSLTSNVVTITVANDCVFGRPLFDRSDYHAGAERHVTHCSRWWAIVIPVHRQLNPRKHRIGC